MNSPSASPNAVTINNDREIRVRFMGIDAQGGEILRTFWRVVEPELPKVLEGFYRHVLDVARGQIMSELGGRFELIFTRLGVTNTMSMVRDITPTPRLPYRKGEAISDVEVEGE